MYIGTRNDSSGFVRLLATFVVLACFAFFATEENETKRELREKIVLP